MKKRRNACLVAAEQLAQEYPERATLVVQIHLNPHPTRGFNIEWANLDERYQRKMRLALLRALALLDRE